MKLSQSKISRNEYTALFKVRFKGGSPLDIMKGLSVMEGLMLSLNPVLECEYVENSLVNSEDKDDR